MEVFFERLNEGDVAGAVALMDERIEMRIHVGDNARTLRGVEQVGGWFLRADKGLKMIPGDVRDLGNTYQADLVVAPPRRAQPAPRRPVPRRGRQDHLDQPDAVLALTRGSGPVPRPVPAASGAPRRPAPSGSVAAVRARPMPRRPRSGTGIVTLSPTLIRLGFLIFGFAAISCSTVTSFLRAIFDIVSPFATT